MSLEPVLEDIKAVVVEFEDIDVIDDIIEGFRSVTIRKEQKTNTLKTQSQAPRRSFPYYQ